MSKDNEKIKKKQDPKTTIDKQEKIEESTSKEKKSSKNSSKKFKHIPIIILIVIVVLILLGLFLYKMGIIFKVKDPEFKEDWQTAYYNFLKEDLYGDSKEKEENIKKYAGYATLNIEHRKDTKIAFIDVGSENPYMVVTSERNTNDKEYDSSKGPFEKMANVGFFYIDKSKKNNIARTMIGLNIGDKYQILYLYDKEEQKYGWYIVIEKRNPVSENYKISVQSIKDFVEYGIKNSNKDASEYVPAPEFNYKEFKDITNKFIIIDKNEIELKSIEKIKEKDLGNLVIDSYDDFETVEELVDDDIKTKVETILKEEQAKKEAEEKEKQAREEKAKKEAEEERKKSGFQVGGYTLKFGKYEYNMDNIYYLYYILNPDYTCTYIDSDGKSFSCTFKIGRADDGQDISTLEEKDAIIITRDGYDYSYFPKPNGFRDTGLEDFIYIGN